VALSGAITSQAGAQELTVHEAGTREQTPLQSATEIVKVDVSVLNHDGDFVGGLAQSNFRILDHGSDQPIIFFAPVETPARVLVVIETSPAVYLIQNEHLAAAYALVYGLAPDDQVALATYDRAPRAVLDFTADKSALLAALGNVQYTIGMGELNFYDSVSALLDWLGPATGKKALVLLTTGLDSSSPARWDALVQKLRRQDVVIFSVALGESLRGGPGKKPKSKKTAPKPDSDASEEGPSRSDVDAGFARADSALRSLAEITGGRAYFPQSAKDFAPMYREIASALRHQYVLGIQPAHDGQFHSLSVEVVKNDEPLPSPPKPSEYRVLARSGYLAPAP
jgi:Ca-activated chloride channel homolog